MELRAVCSASDRSASRASCLHGSGVEFGLVSGLVWWWLLSDPSPLRDGDALKPRSSACEK